MPVRQSEKSNLHVIRVPEGKEKGIWAEIEVMVNNFPKLTEDFN